MLGTTSDNENSLRIPPLASERAANGWFMLAAVDTAGTHSASSDKREADFNQLDVLVRIDDRSCCSSMANRAIEYRTTDDVLMRHRLALEVGHRLDRRVILHRPIDREAARTSRPTCWATT